MGVEQFDLYNFSFRKYLSFDRIAFRTPLFFIPKCLQSEIANLIIIIYNDVYKIPTEKVRKPTIASFWNERIIEQNENEKEMQCEYDTGNETTINRNQKVHTQTQCERRKCDARSR